MPVCGRMISVWPAVRPPGMRKANCGATIAGRGPRGSASSHSPASSQPERLARVAKLCGEDFAAHVIELSHDIESLHLTGWLALPTFSRSQSDLQFSFLNGRFVRDKLLAGAVRLAYQDTMFHGRFCAYLLYLELDAILAVVVGGTSLQGGRFYLVGAVVGALFIQTLTTTLYARNVSSDVSPVPKALVIIAVCLFQSDVFRARAARLGQPLLKFLKPLSSRLPH